VTHEQSDEREREMTDDPQKRAMVVRGTEVAPLVPKTFEAVWRMAVALSKSGMAPANMKRPEDIAIAILMGLEIGLLPMQASQNIAVINGRPTLWGDGLLAVVQASGLLSDFWETPIEENGKVVGYLCHAERRDRSKPIERKFTIEDAKTAGLWGKRGRNGQPTPWVTYPDRMLQMRARSFALRDGFADVLKGVIAREEARDFIDVEATVLPAVPDGPDVSGAAPETPANAGSATSPKCPECGGPMWDNRDKRKEAQADKTRTKKLPPAWNCKNRDCKGAIWESGESAAAKQEVALAPSEERDAMLAFFKGYNVTEQQVLDKLGRRLIDEVTEDDVASLRKIAGALKAGEHPEAHFPAASEKPDRPVGREKAIEALEQLERYAGEGFEFLEACRAAGVDHDDWRAADEPHLSAIFDAMTKGEAT